jgi:cobalt/nickel transport system permease protein
MTRPEQTSSAIADRVAPQPPTTPLLRSVDPRVRLLVCIVFAFVTVSLSHMAGLLGALGLAVAAALLARLEPASTLKRLAALDGFMFFVLGLLPFTMPGTPLFSIAGFEASQEGLWRAAEILLKSNAIVLMILALPGTMEQVELGHAMAGLRVPEKFVHLFLFTVRYIDVLGREYRRLRTSMRARGFTMRCNLHTWRSVGYLFGMLMIRSIERSERIVAAMRCRGFQGRLPSLADTQTVRGTDRAFAVVSLAACIALFTLEHA